MFGILKLTKAEFIKIFKKPSVYIMGLLLAVITTASLFSFAPNKKESDYLVNITGNTAEQVYTKFYSNTGSDNKNNIDDNFIKSIDLIEFYQNLNAKNSSVLNAKNEFINAQYILNTELSISPTVTESIENKFNIVLEKLNNLKTIYNNSYNLDENSFFSYYLQTNAFNQANENIDLIIYHANSNSPSAYNNIFNASEFISLLEGIEDNFITTTLDYFTDLITTNYTNITNMMLSLNSTSTIPSALNTSKTNMQNALIQYNSFLNDVFYDNVKLILLINNDYIANYIKSVDTLIQSFEDFDSSTESNMYQKYNVLISQINNLGFINKIKNIYSEIDYVSIPPTTLSYLKSLITTNIYNAKDKIIENIDNIYNNATTETESESMLALNKEFTKYKSLSLSALNFTNNSLILNILADKSEVEIINLKSYYPDKEIVANKYNTYQLKQVNAKILYLIENNKLDSDYLNVFAFNENSGNSTNFYDFMYYALKISSVAIILFVIIMAANIMAFEFDNGTIKLLAIRPFKRYKIVFGKLFAVIFFALIFVLFSALISFIGGILMFSNTTLPNVLVIFNAASIIKIAPSFLMLINIASIFIEVVFYAIIALSLSTLFKSFASALTSSFIFYISGIALNIVSQNFKYAGAWYTYIPFANTDFFRFLGGFSINSESSIMNLIFNNALMSSANIVTSVVIYITTTLIFLTASLMVFKKRDL